MNLELNVNGFEFLRKIITLNSMIDSIPQVQFVQIGQQPKNFKSFLRKFAEFSFYQTVLDSQISKYPLEFPAPFNYYQSTKNMTVK